MSKRRRSRDWKAFDSTTPFSFPAQQYKVTSEELDTLLDSFIDLIIDDFIEKYRSGQLDVAVLIKKGGQNA